MYFCTYGIQMMWKVPLIRCYICAVDLESIVAVLNHIIGWSGVVGSSKCYASHAASILYMYIWKHLTLSCSSMSVCPSVCQEVPFWTVFCRWETSWLPWIHKGQLQAEQLQWTFLQCVVSFTMYFIVLHCKRYSSVDLGPTTDLALCTD